jgi:hypothetical protein
LDFSTQLVQNAPPGRFLCNTTRPKRSSRSFRAESFCHMKRGQPYDPEKKKKEGYDSAMIKFNAWRTSCGYTNDIETSEINPKLFTDFCEYLFNGKSRANQPYALGTIWQYTSGAYNVIKKKYPSLPLWQEDLVLISGEYIPRWYRTIRNNMDRKVCNRVIEEGGKIQTKSEPIGRPLLKKISLALLSKADVESVEMATNFVWDYVSCGR